MNNIEKKKEKLMNKEISVFDLTKKEVEQISQKVKEDLDEKKQELKDVNQKIKEIKVKIDNCRK